MDAKTELEEMDKVFKRIVKECVTDNFGKDPNLAVAAAHFQRVWEYTVHHDNQVLAVILVSSYRHHNPNPSEEDIFLARVMGCALEFFSAWAEVADDVMDRSPTRAGKPCWYTHKEIGLMAVNDACNIQMTVFKILQKYYSKKPYYLSVLERFLEFSHMLTVGQGMDMLTAIDNGVVDFSKFSMERYKTIVKYKTAYYCYCHPVTLAMLMAGKDIKNENPKVVEILYELGYLFQVENDYLDVYGEKVGTDIEDNKCSWIIIQALSRCSEKQRVVLETNYAKKDQESVKKVKQVFNDLNLQKVYEEFAAETRQDLLSKINTISVPESTRKMLLFQFSVFKYFKD